MNKIFLFLALLFCTNLFSAKQNMWAFQYSFNLKKDKIATVFINKNVKNKNKKPRYALRFRWTLYDAGENLYLFVDYMNHPNQYILKKKRHLDRVVIKLLPDGKDYNGRTYAMLVFADFDKNKREATIEVYIKDQPERARVEFKPPKRK